MINKIGNNRYIKGGTTETNSVGLGFWAREVMEFRNDDILITLTERQAQRPSLITKQLYGKDNLMWIVLQYNSILDPVTELVEGTTIRMPHPSRIT